MKTRMGVMGVIGVMVVACGCGQKPDPHDAKIKALEERVAKAEGKLAEEARIMTEFVSMTKEINGRFESLRPMVEEMGPLMTNLVSEIQRAPTHLDYLGLALRVGWLEEEMWQTHPDAVRRTTNSLSRGAR